MKSITDPRDRVAKFEQAKTEFEEFVTPYIEAWLEIEVSSGHLSKDDAEQTFSYDCTDPKGIWFASQDWEETWRYGGYEKHYGREILIPFEFFEDMQTFQDDAKKKKAEIERINAANEKARRRQAVKEAEARLAYAKSELGNVK